MKKLILIGVLFITACNNNKPMLDSLDTSRPENTDTSLVTVQVPVSTATQDSNETAKYFYEYAEVLNKGERGIYKSYNNNLHKGDHISVNKGYKTVVVELTTEAQELK